MTNPRPTAATHVRWNVFSLSFGISFVLYLHRYAFASIKPALAEEWELSNTQLGQLDTAFTICYTAFQFPLGMAADVVGVHWVLGSLMLLWCGGFGLVALSPTVGWMLFARASMGTGQSAVYACLNRVSRMWYPPAVRTTLQGSVGVLAGRLGGLGAMVLFTSLMLGSWNLGWRKSAGILTAVGLVNWLLFVIVFRNSPRQHSGVNEAEALLIEGDDPPTMSARLSLREALRSMTPRSFLNLLWLSVQNILSTFADNIYSNWIPLFLAQVHHLKFQQMGIYSALPLLGGAIAGVIGGMLNDVLIARTGNRRWSRVGVAFVGKSMAAVLTFAALLYYDQPYVFCGFLFFVKLFGDWSLSTSLGVVTDIGGRATASVFAFSNTVAGIAFVLAPIVFGYVSEHYGWRPVFVIVGVTYVLCALSWLVIDCTLPIVAERDPRGDDATNG